MKHFIAVMYLLFCELSGVIAGLAVYFVMTNYGVTPPQQVHAVGAAVMTGLGMCLIAFGVSVDRWRSFKRS